MNIFRESSLTKEEIEDLEEATIFVGIEIEIIYERFSYIDRNEQGYITTAELLLIPEFGSNPLSTLISSYVESIYSSGKLYFATFVDFLEKFSSKSPKEKRTKFLFDVFDVEKEGRLSRETLLKIYEMMTGKIDDEEVEKVLRAYGGGKDYLEYVDFERMYEEDGEMEDLMVINFMEFLPQKKSYSFLELILPNFKFNEH